YVVDDEVVDRRMAEDDAAVLGAAESQGVWLWVASGYRSRRRQEDILESAIQERMVQGLSREQARAKALETIAQPGHSEHETGLALDFNDVSQGFQETEAYQWLRQHGAAYGFIQRYQREKEDVTGVKAEPWHFRYVGREHALAMERLGLCLEEYVRWQRALGGP
ncbi:MAG: D-alanyl-D-alanine carboxypeptidase family protein, partial [Acutalibacter sp.]